LLYAEVYNLEPDPPEYYVHIWVLDRFGGIVRDLGIDTVTRPGESALLVYGLQLAGLAQGERHMLALEVEHGENVATARDSFWLGIGPAGSVAGAQKEFTEADAKLNQQFITYIATPGEMKEYQALGLEGKQRFLDAFWRQRDPNPNTEVNEYLQQHIARFIVANDRFSRSMLQRDDGWNTDRGRVLILYGDPSRIVQQPSAVGTWSWERWEYDTIEGGVFFIFLDWKNLGDYRLMHSNMRGERYDPEWQKKIEVEGLDILSR
jgi:GWxTD domain-containing protein